MNIDTRMGVLPVGTTASSAAPPAVEKTARELNKTYLKLISNSEPFPWLNHDTRADGFNYPAKDLLRVMSMQSKAISVVSTVSTERSVAGSLTDSIEKNAQVLQDMLNQTAGGVLTFDFILERLFKGLSSKPLEGINVENMFVVAMLDVLPHLNETGLVDDLLASHITTLLELLGSGSHNSSNLSPAFFLFWTQEVWSGLSTIVNDPPFGPDSVLHKAMTLINGGNPITATMPNNLMLQIMNYDNVAAGGWYNASLDDFSPTVRMFLLRELMNKQVISLSEIDIVLAGTKAEIDQMFTEKLGADALTVLSWGGKWRIQTIHSGLPGGITQVIDYEPYITTPEALDLATTFPGRDLTKEDLKEINNIGDQVKMLMQSLKYWLTTLRDEQLAISRNIA